MAFPISRDQAQGALVGMALGNSLGFLVAGESPKYCADFARHSLTDDDPPWLEKDGFSFGQYAADVQLARELASCLVEARGFDPIPFAARVGELFQSGAVVAPGKATARAGKRLAAGMAWAQTGEPAPQAGNSAAIRAVPIGLSFKDAAKRSGSAEMQASVTHHDPRAKAGAQLVAEAVFLAATAPTLARQDFLDRLADTVDPLDARLAHSVRTLERHLTLAPDKALTTLAATGYEARDGFPSPTTITPFVTPSLAFSLFAFLRAPDDPNKVLEGALAGGGDTPSTGAFAGALVGARLGFAGLGHPLLNWSIQLNDRGEHKKNLLLDLGAKLVDRKRT